LSLSTREHTPLRRLAADNQQTGNGSTQIFIIAWKDECDVLAKKKVEDPYFKHFHGLMV
jgi:hypothetical protein